MRCLFVAQRRKVFQMGQLAQAIERLGVETSVLNYSDSAPLSPRFTVVPSPEFARFISHFRPDVVFTDTYGFDAWFARAFSCPTIAYMLGDFWEEFRYLYYIRAEVKSVPRLVASTWIKFIHERGLDFSHTIMPVSKWLAERVRSRLTHKRVKVLYHPFDSRIQTSSEGGRSLHLRHPAVVSLFQFRVWPKLIGLIRFFEVATKMPDLNFYIAGSGPYFKRLTSMKIPSNLVFLGELEYPTEVKAFLTDGEVYAHPSGLDACPVSVMEAQLMEKPVIASNVGGIPEVTSNAQLLVDYDDTRSWIRSIRYLLDHPDEAKRIGLDGRRYVERKFAVEMISRELFQYLQGVVL